MRLKRLEITGFKSFKDTVNLDFTGGISAVIGPNGCGKSNIVDAIRWVMGEQRVTALRGKKMEDVIFNGSDDAAPVGMAEVMLILEGDGYKFPGQYADCSEVMISRRLFRDGESEYTINKVRCRLLDVREFFMDTGVGIRTYSLVEQNSISTLVEAKPEERRQFIEEAAGIAKYKSRKEAALRRMESTRQNLLRLTDILREVKSQLNSLSRQAKRAEKYKDMKREIREIETGLALQACHDLATKKETLREAYEAIKQNIMAAETRLGELDADMEAIRSEGLENEEKISKLQERLYTVKNEITVTEKDIEYSRGRITDLTAKQKRNAGEVESFSCRKKEMEEEIRTLGALHAEAEAEIGRIRQSISESQAIVEDLKAREKEHREALEKKKVSYFDLMTENARLKNLMTGLMRSIEELKRRAEREGRELEEYEEKAVQAQTRLADVQMELSAALGKSERLREEAPLFHEQIEKSRNELEESDAHIAELKDELGMKSSRLASLREFHSGYEWCNDGIRSIVKVRPDCGLSREAVYGLVADHIEVPKEYETAVEAVLGEKLKYVIVKSQEEGVKAIDYLKTQSSGRGSFIPLAVRSDRYDFGSPDYLKETIRLLDVVKVQEDFNRIADYLLGDILLIPNLDAGVALWQRNGFRGTFVTPEGDTISPHGVLTGGSQNITDENSLLKRKREISGLDGDVGRLKAELSNELENRNALSALLSEKDEEWENLKSELRDLDLIINGKRKDVERIEGELRWINQRVGVLQFNKESAASEEKEAKEKIAGIEGEALSCEARAKEVNHLIAGLQANEDILKKELEDKEQSLTHSKVSLASLEEKRNAGLKALERLHQSVQSLAGEIELRIKDMDMSGQGLGETAISIENNKKLLEILYEEYGRIEKEAAGLKELEQNRENDMGGRESEARELRKQADHFSKEANQLDLDMRELALQIENLKNNLYEKYSVDLFALMEGFRILEEEQIQEMRATLEKGRKSVEDFGEVNLLAIGEFEQLKERHEFLQKQIEDLEASLDSLQKTITKINQISRKRFAETFEAVNECFKTVFPKLFRGGKGVLKLTESEDMLEAGVDIDLQLPGKRAQNIHLLSGGEKSMSAVALIFAIILYRPTPFLVLDEVDAALDDANITLFNQFLKEISSASQIIVVTHSKQTMEVADNLYGVSMEKKGISNLISVSLQ
jgi:chromosome segregation protein